jgi:KUP system potassium uptake protein
MDVVLPHENTTRPKEGILALALGSAGVVYGDIGTSPLYALKESVITARGEGGMTPDVVFGVLSLVFWALIVIVTLKYVVVMLRADNKGEGGVLTLMALAQRAAGPAWAFIALLGIAGSALFYGDAIITPAISVLSAVEGLSLATPAFNPYVLVISMGILIGLFAVQSRGTARVAAWFGPVMTVWFIVLAIGGLAHIVARPGVLSALNPAYAVSFIAVHRSAAFLALGAVFLAVTGAEALYADLGHFGRTPIRLAWLALVFPALCLNYFGQGALLLDQPEAIESPFFRLYPAWALLPMVALATVATIIASQAVITGAFSLTQQAIQLGLLPRFDIRSTSESEKGQIYIARVNNWLLMAVLLIVASFRTSGALASAYGVAVTGTMVISALLAFIVVWKDWSWPLWRAMLLMIPFLLIDLIFFAANSMKIVEGGWLPLLVGAFLMLVMLTWRKGSRLLASKTRRDEMDMMSFLPTLETSRLERVRGTAVFLSASPDTVPTALLHNIKHNKILHESNIILSVTTADTPYVSDADRFAMSRLSESFIGVRLKFGYMEEPNVPKALALCRRHGLKFDVMNTSFFLSRRTLRLAARSEMAPWRTGMFITLARSANDASDYFKIPTERSIDIGTQVVI